MTNTASPEPGSLGTQTQTRAVAPLGAGLSRPGPVGLARPARYRVANTPYDFNKGCQSKDVTACDDGSKFVSWDGVHITEAGNAVVAKAILSSQYSKPNLKFDQFCRV